MSNAYVDPWDMLNNFCFHVYAEMSLFMGENVNVFFLTATPSNHRAGSQLKSFEVKRSSDVGVTFVHS